MVELSHYVKDKLQMQHYVELVEMLYKAILVEQQLKNVYADSPMEVLLLVLHILSMQGYLWEKFYYIPSPTIQDNKGKVMATTTRTRDVKCFKFHGREHYANECSNKKAMKFVHSEEYETRVEEEFPDS